MSGYQVVLADPPWPYNDKRIGQGGCAKHYTSMPLRDIYRLPVRDIADKNSILFLWATWPHMESALETIRWWGFKYKTCGFLWVKTNVKNGKTFFGIGHYTKSNTEPCLLAVKGKPRVASNYISQLIVSSRMKHSQKPPEVRDKIVQLMGDIPRIELFAREQAPGWDAWGIEVPIGTPGSEVLPLLW